MELANIQFAVMHNSAIDVTNLLQHHVLEENVVELLPLAVYHGAEEALAVLINAVLPKSPAAITSKYDGYTLLHIAARGGFDNCIRRILQSIDDDAEFINAKSDQKTALAMAAECGHTGAVETLINAGAKVINIYRFNRPILHIAANSGNIELLEKLTTTEDSMWPFEATKAGLIPLFFAVQSRSMQAVEWILEKMSQASALPAFGQKQQARIASIKSSNSEAIEAAKLGLADILNLLLSFQLNGQPLYGIGCKAPDSTEQNNSLLHVAMQNNRNNVLSVLLDHMRMRGMPMGVCLSTFNAYNNTALYEAVVNRNYQGVSALLENGANSLHKRPMTVEEVTNIATDENIRVKLLDYIATQG